MTFKEAFVLEKLNQLAGYLDESKYLFRFSTQEILDDSEKMHIAERVFQLLVDSMIDINQHFIQELNLKTVDDLQGTFYILGENRVLPIDFAQKIAPVVGLRNRIVHRYEDLDKKLFIITFQKNLDDFSEYIKLINNYLEKELI